MKKHFSFLDAKGCPSAETKASWWFSSNQNFAGVESALSTGAAPSTNLPTGGTDCDRQAPAREHAQPPQLHLRQLRSHLQLLHRCQRHVGDDGSWPRWAHNPERKSSFLEPDQNRKTVPSDVAGVLQLTEHFALPCSQKT